MLAYLGEQMDPHVDTCPDCRARRLEYQRIAAALAQESPRALPDGWMEALQSKLIAKSVASSSPRLPRIEVPDDVPPATAPRKPPPRARGAQGSGPLAAVVAPRRAMWFAGGGGVVAMAVAIAVVLLWPKKPGMDAFVTKGAVAYRGAESEHHVGDVLHVEARPGDADRFELRVYLDGSRLVFRCPGESPPDCRVDDGVVVRYALPAPGRYEVVWLHADSVIPEPLGSLDLDVNAARGAGAGDEIEEPIDVE